VSSKEVHILAFQFVIFAFIILLFLLTLTVPGRRKVLSVIVFIVLIFFQIINVAVTHKRETNRKNQISQLKEELELEKIRVKPVSLDLYGREIKGSKLGFYMTFIHDACFRVDSIRKAIISSDVNKADRISDSLIGNYPSFAGAYFWKGAIAIAQEKDSECESLWTIAVELEPQNIAYALLYRNIGIIRMKIGNTTKAIEAFNTALSVALIVDEMHKATQEQGKKPDTRISVAECYFLIARAYEAAGQKDSADIFLKKATNLNPEWKKRWNEQIKIIIP